MDTRANMQAHLEAIKKMPDAPRNSWKTSKVHEALYLCAEIWLHFHTRKVMYLISWLSPTKAILMFREGALKLAMDPFFFILKETEHIIRYCILTRNSSAVTIHWSMLQLIGCKHWLN